MTVGDPNYRKFARLFARLLHRRETVGLTPAQQAEYEWISARMAEAELQDERTKRNDAQING